MRTFKTILLLMILFMAVSCSQNSKSRKLTETQQEEYLDKGMVIISTTFGVLSGNLQQAMKSDGIVGAIRYCNLKADPLVDSLSQSLHAGIKRTSLQLRNMQNDPTEIEKTMLEFYKSKFENGEKVSPEIKILENGNIGFFAPIIINTPLCLNCHGELNNTLKEENYAIIQTLYPEDKAIGYKAGDYRGMWSIEFEKDH